MNQIYDILQSIRPDSDFSSSEDFVEDYLLDSFDIITLTTELENLYDIKIQTGDIIPENYHSIEAIASLVRKCGGKT